MKVVPNRRWIGVDNPLWARGAGKVQSFRSEWGAPFGTNEVLLSGAATLEIGAEGTDLSVAYRDQPGGGKLSAAVDGREAWEQPADVPYTDRAGAKYYVENRKGIRNLPFGRHTVTLQARGGPVAVLGLFTYDTRSGPPD